MSVSPGIEIVLAPMEIAIGRMVAVTRHYESIRQGLQDKHGFYGDGLRIHIFGVLGEMAAAKAANLYWDASVNTFKTVGDVGDIEVRTRMKDHYDLIVRDDDKPNRFFVLVVFRGWVNGAPVFRVIGWMSGVEAKQDRWKKTYGDREAAYFVPQAALHPISGLNEREDRHDPS